MGDATILITGSSGLVGHPLSRHLAPRGDRVVGLDPATPLFVRFRNDNKAVNGHEREGAA